jgi:hypothetical protein
MRHLGVRGLAVHCLSPNCGHQAVFSADDYPDDVEVASFHSQMLSGEYGGKHVNVQPNWKEQPVQMSLTGVALRTGCVGIAIAPVAFAQEKSGSAVYSQN